MLEAKEVLREVLAKEVLREVLDCGNMEVDMLLDSNIDIYGTMQYIRYEDLPINMQTIYVEAFRNILAEVFQVNNNILDFDQNDFDIYYNGALDTHIYIKTGRYQYYKDKYPQLIEEIEYYMDMEFNESI